MIERWQPETHTFHLPIGEVNITLEDVKVLFGLPVDGLPVAYPHALRDYTGLHYLHMLQRLTGFQPAEETALSGATRLQLTLVQQHLEAMNAEITDDSPSEFIDRHTRLVLLLMFGGVVFPNILGNLADVLGSMGTQRDVAGFLPLLQVWAWERFLQFQPPLTPITPDVPPPPFLPLGGGLIGEDTSVRSRLDIISPITEICWICLKACKFLKRPYNDVLIAGLLDYCSCGRAMWSSSILLICLDIVEHHATEVDQTYLDWLEAQIKLWDQRYDLIPPPPAPERMDGEHEYMGWYRSVTRLHVGNPVHCVGGRYIPYAGRHEAQML
uniref:Serine/threonine-protein phosphatase 7 long form homolog n=1 Tax=Nicotiana tabacum TaxID=4097 RepID=A0A1S3Y152_TOBAC|nr:PREDICTED: serine/threonine-protein phosphatase 7 long form homolog [Nicotiana tabacum]